MKCFTFILLLLFSTTLVFSSGEKEKDHLKIALLPVIDSLPYYIAEQEGFFKDLSLSVEIVPINSPLERDQLMQSEAIDGMLNELSSTALFNQEKTKIQIVHLVRRSEVNSPIFRILASPKSGFQNTSDLKNINIGVSKNSIIEYITDRLLQKEGFVMNEIQTQSVPLIPERFQLLMFDKIKAATLPDPLAAAAISAGAIPLIDDSLLSEQSLTVLSFHINSITNKKESIEKFVLAWQKAVMKLNENRELYRSLMLEKIRVPESIEQSYKIPSFVKKGIPSESSWNDTILWLENKELLDNKPNYKDSINNLINTELE